MKRIIEKIKTKKELFIGIIIGGIAVSLVGVVGTIATNTITSNYVLYNSSTGKTNVKEAIDELYNMASTNCPEGYTYLNNITATGATVVAPNTSDTHLGIVYLDPTNLNRSCNASNSVSTTETKTGCMKWYIYNMSETTYNLILNHNTTAKVSNYSAAQTQIKTDTSNWVSSLNPRNITADEIYQITKSTNGKSSWSQETANTSDFFFFDGNRSSGRGTSKYAWLFDYTTICTSYGCNVADLSTHGYWTQNMMAGTSSLAWYVSYNGKLDTENVIEANFGVRPVITISKS